MDIFTEFLAFDEGSNEVAKALDDAVACLLPHPLIKFCQNRAPHRPPPHFLYNSESELDSDNEMDLYLPWREVQDIPSFLLMNIMRNPPQQPTEKQLNFFLYRMILPLLTSVTTMIGMDCEVTESVMFHPMDQIYNSIKLWDHYHNNRF